VSTHTNYLMLEFLKNVASFLSKRAAYSIEAALSVKQFFESFQPLNLLNLSTFASRVRRRILQHLQILSSVNFQNFF
ncbi:MAG: hypothetical protein CMI06_04720, partial [Oceanospirillaceae bacterium]|nr:hypothetical protein [Oceanospirillaceae bacterium]